MQKVSAIGFIFLYMLAMLRPIQPYVEYALNQKYISEFLCINKDKPKLQCNGKCHLTKQIEKQKEKDPLSALSIALENYPIGFVDILKISFLDAPISQQNQIIISYKALYSFNYSYAAFQPPDFV